ncbi:MAG TPA: hypothetical protein VF169_21565 [Albitalea sp.]|uniref:hypothetical protein n=1 Tax=Piscinibacter sp. TaxID=1903157 RepID=UPI002ED2F85E
MNAALVRINQADLAELVGVSESRISQLVSEGHLAAGDDMHAWILAYCSRLRAQAADRGGESVLTRERAKLARAQTESLELKNAITLETYAPTSVLAEILAMTRRAIADRLDALPSQLRTAHPALPNTAFHALSVAIASARDEWVRATATLVVAPVDDNECDQGNDEEEQLAEAAAKNDAAA